MITSPKLDFKKKIYKLKSSAEEAVEQMKKLFKNDEYYILPIYTDIELYNKMMRDYYDRYKQIKQENEIGIS